MPYNLVPNALQNLRRDLRGVSGQIDQHELAMGNLGLQGAKMEHDMERQKWSDFMATPRPVDETIEMLPWKDETKKKILAKPEVQFLIERGEVVAPAKLYEAFQASYATKAKQEEADLLQSRTQMNEALKHQRATELLDKEYGLKGGLERTKAEVGPKDVLKMSKVDEVTYNKATEQLLDIEQQLALGKDDGSGAMKPWSPEEAQQLTAYRDQLAQKISAIDAKYKSSGQSQGAGGFGGGFQLTPEDQAGIDSGKYIAKYNQATGELQLVPTGGAQGQQVPQAQQLGPAPTPQAEQPAQQSGPRLEDFTDIGVNPTTGNIYGTLNGVKQLIMRRPSRTEMYYGKTRPSSEYAAYQDMLRRIGQVPARR